MSTMKRSNQSFLTPKKLPQKKVSLKDFTKIAVQGKGGFAKVLLVRKNDNNKIYAMKIIKKSFIHELGLDEQVLTERNVLVQADHPFIVKMYFSFQDQRKLYFILDYCPGGELWNKIVKNSKLNEETAKFYAGQIILVIEYLHENDIIYRDQKPENILIGEDGYIRLTDFGLSYMAKNNEMSIYEAAGTPEYYAPELVCKKKYSKPVDWWCIGTQLFEMLTGFPPFFTANKQELFAKIQYSEPKYPDYLSPSVLNQIKGLLKKKPDIRIGTKKGAEELKNHEWFENFQWDSLLHKRLTVLKPELINELDIGNFDPEIIAMEINSPMQNVSQMSPLLRSNAYLGFSGCGEESYKQPKRSSGDEDDITVNSPQLGKNVPKTSEDWENLFANSFRKIQPTSGDKLHTVELNDFDTDNFDTDNFDTDNFEVNRGRAATMISPTDTGLIKQQQLKIKEKRESS